MVERTLNLRSSRPAQPGRESDECLVESALAGDRRAFERLVRRHQRALVNHLYRHTGQRDLAVDLAQEVFLKVWENRKRLDPGQSFNAYLFTVARNTIFNMHRKKLNEIAYLEHLEASTSLRDSETERLVDFRELHERLDRCVDHDHEHLFPGGIGHPGRCCL